MTISKTRYQDLHNAGQYVGNRKHGFGVYSWADGATEEGQHLGPFDNSPGHPMGRWNPGPKVFQCQSFLGSANAVILSRPRRYHATSLRTQVFQWPKE